MSTCGCFTLEENLGGLREKLIKFRDKLFPWFCIQTQIYCCSITWTCPLPFTSHFVPLHGFSIYTYALIQMSEGAERTCVGANGARTISRGTPLSGELNEHLQ